MKALAIRLAGSVLAAASMAVLAAGCAAFRAKVSDVDLEDPEHLRASYDYADMRRLTEEIVADLLTSPFLVDQQTPPVVMIPGVENRTSQYVDTKALTDRIRTLIFQSGKMQFVNEARREALMKEQAYQRGNVTPETQAAIGRQIGARYMLTGSLIQMSSESMRQARVSKRQVAYYKLTIELTDLETSLIAWTAEKEFAREARKPLIGW